MSTDQPSSSASSRLSRTGGRWRKPVSLSEAGTEGTGTGAAVFLALAFFVPAWPSSRYGLTPVRFTFFAQVVAAIDTLPPARPNCASIAAWLEGISPYCHFVALRGLISKVALPAH